MLLCLETGIRVSELVGIRLDDVPRLKEGKILIHGKGFKQRFVPFQSKFRRALRGYLRSSIGSLVSWKRASNKGSRTVIDKRTTLLFNEAYGRHSYPSLTGGGFSMLSSSQRGYLQS
ncbi:tyrosine-type recombinase/integrase [Alicyclobacillus mengziensis]|uniref:Tyrosine-type recombinase/integrase n=1 Tax=Alicyclobacillus mengziensis TaxID=2931921 RepID=A0A9X7VYL1_9BACL|nr:tyrosine-type recombinase/integrase [Alicyclobacillus mengziensis]